MMRLLEVTVVLMPKLYLNSYLSFSNFFFFRLRELKWVVWVTADAAVDIPIQVVIVVMVIKVVGVDATKFAIWS